MSNDKLVPIELKATRYGTDSFLRVRFIWMLLRFASGALKTRPALRGSNRSGHYPWLRRESSQPGRNAASGNLFNVE